MTDTQDNPNSFIEILLTVTVLSVLAGIASGIFYYRKNIAQAFREVAQENVAISTTPAGAKLIFDGQYIGLSPQVVKANRGAHTVIASLDGYITSSQAVSFNYQTGKDKFYSDPWVVNINLEKSNAPATSSSDQPTPAQQPSLADNTVTALQKQIDDLRGIVLVKPQDAITISAMKDRIILLTDQNQQMKEEIREIRSYSGWVVGIAVTTIFSFIGFILSLFLITRNKST